MLRFMMARSSATGLSCAIWKQFNYSQASNAKCLTSMFYCEASEGFRRFALLCVDSIYFGAVKRHWHCMCLHRKIFVHPFGLIRWPFNFI